METVHIHGDIRDAARKSLPPLDEKIRARIHSLFRRAYELAVEQDEAKAAEGAAGYVGEGPRGNSKPAGVPDEGGGAGGGHPAASAVPTMDGGGATVGGSSAVPTPDGHTPKGSERLRRSAKRARLVTEQELIGEEEVKRSAKSVK